MRQTTFALAVLTAALLAACGGSGEEKPGDQAVRVKFSTMVSFGDSLSDVGTYAVGTVAAAGGGKFTINGNNTAKNPALTGRNWTELMAAQFGLPAPCAAQTGLDGDPAKGFAVAVTNHAGCYSYAQGGARVSHPVGPGHKLTGSPVGMLTVPVVTQVGNHLAKTGGTFSGTEVVFVTAGGNDALALLGQLTADATAAGQVAGAAEGARVGAQTYITTLVSLLAAGAADPAGAAVAIGTAVQIESQRPGSTTETITQTAIGAAVQAGFTSAALPEVHGPIVVKAQTTAQSAGATAGATAGKAAAAAYVAAHAAELVTAMGGAGAELAGIVKTMIVGKGANYVVVNNLPDLGGSPAGKKQDPSIQTLINTMVATFNTQLKNGLGTDSKILYVDLFTTSHDQIVNPGPYGLTNTSTAACATNILEGNSLVCNGSNLIAGDVSHFMFADDVLPTPFENALIAKYVALQMVIKGWL